MQSGIILFSVLALVSSSHSFEEDSPTESESIVICRHCGHDLFDPQQIFSLVSPGSIRSNNNTLIGSVRSRVQLLRNPHGYEFEVVTVRRSICKQQGDWHSSHSWFPGYSWRICICPKCGTHIGWIFKQVEAKDKPATPHNSFYGLIFEKILEESTAEAPLTDEQLSFLEECESEFTTRFSEDDPQFVEAKSRGVPTPPVMTSWFARRPRGGGGGGGGWRERGGGGWRDRNQRQQPYDREGRYNRNQRDNERGPRDNPYNRNPRDNPYDRGPRENPYERGPRENPYDRGPRENPYDRPPHSRGREEGGDQYRERYRDQRGGRDERRWDRPRGEDRDR